MNLSDDSLVQLRQLSDVFKNAHTRRSCGFRKAFFSHFPSHRPHLQHPPKTPQTCFEGPFGEVLRGTDPMAKANPFRFSTKYQDDETDLLYYGRRYYNASTGRWVNRDPAEERGGVALFVFVNNAPCGKTDPLGLLMYETVYSPEPGECAGTKKDWQIAWWTGTSEKGGSVIQHIVWSGRVHNCLKNTDQPIYASYYEVLGYIPKGQNTTGNAVDDMIGVGSRGLWTKGTITITATATFYDNGISSLPPGFRPGDGGGPWGFAPYSFYPPSGPDWVAGDPVSRYLTVSWDCCCPHRLDTELTYN